MDARASTDFADAHILTAVNFHFKSLVDAQSGVLKPTKELIEDFGKVGIRFDVPKDAAAAAAAKDDAR